MKKGWLIGLLVIAVIVFAVVQSGIVENDTLKSDVIIANPAVSISDNPSLIMQKAGKVLPEFSFEMAENKAFSNQDLSEHWTLFFIGYTFCPDICPTTLADLDRVYPELSKPPYDNVQIVFVSVDPNRDKANNLAEYVNYFNANFIGTTSTHEVLFPFSQDLGLVYSIVEEGDLKGNKDAYYLVDHSASLVLVNPDGEHQATFKAVLNEDGIPHVDMDQMTEGIHKIIDLDN
ncbi:photosynthetic protein synthase I [Psychromonas marina]|uniref:Photosynthetic protein synthase I n=1 Tax=Psychromonas marina TaxID=88364 RepID=A0ABQ6DZQ0_9GAMM|nr:SCO family protein [Psychromonas marina]GLS90633.1 photosynthetic protein synthase I [Psychromonas marina]